MQSPRCSSNLSIFIVCGLCIHVYVYVLDTLTSVVSHDERPIFICVNTFGI